MLCFCMTVVGLSNAPVGTKRILRKVPSRILSLVEDHHAAVAVALAELDAFFAEQITQ